MEQLVLKVATEFSNTPGSRYISEGEWSGEHFRKSLLTQRVKDVIEKNKVLLIDLDGTAGYGTSFLEESFGGLIREEGIGYHDIKAHLKFKSDEEPYLLDDIEEYLNAANKKEKKL